MGVKRISDIQAMILLDLWQEGFLDRYDLIENLYKEKLGRPLTEQEEMWLLQTKKNLLDKEGYLQDLRNSLLYHLN